RRRVWASTCAPSSSTSRAPCWVSSGASCGRRGVDLAGVSPYAQLLGDCAMVRFFCDRCDVELESQGDLTTFTAEVGDSAVSSWRSKRELCLKCVEEVKDLLGKFFAKPAPQRRRTA